MDNASRRQIWENIFQLSQAVFRVTHLFPQEEILRRHLRSNITEILYQASQGQVSGSAFPIINHLPIVNALHNFRGLLFSAKNCNFVHEQNFTVLIKECAKIIETLERPGYHPNQFSHHPDPLARHLDSPTGGEVFQLLSKRDSSVTGSLRMNQSGIGFFAPNPRQQKLLDYLQKYQDKKLQLKDITDELKDIQPRTLRQDLKELCDGGYLVRNGRGAGSYYIFSKNNTS